jgi:hypothetical protein
LKSYDKGNKKLRKILNTITAMLLLSTLCLTLTPQLVSSKTQDIKVLSYSHYIDALDILDIVGEIQNTGTSTIERAILTAVVYGSDGTIQGTVTGYAWLSYMAPQQKSPFRLEIISPADHDYWYSAGVSKIEISVKEAKETSSYLYSDFEISVNSAGVSTNYEDIGTYWVEGSVRNIGSQTASGLAACAVFYNSSGCVVAIGRTNYLTPSNVNPSGTVMFKIGAFDTVRYEKTEIVSYALFVEATSPLIEGKAPEATAPVTGASTVTQNPQDPTSNRNSIYIAIAVVGVFVVIVVLLMSHKNIPPKSEKNNRKNCKQKKHYLKNIDTPIELS